MAEQRSVTIRVPATTANLGPGFDCLGLALDLWNEVTFSLGGQTLNIQIQGEGKNDLPTDHTNLIVQAFLLILNKFKIIPPDGLTILCRNRIPVSSGLGSSSSAVIAGLLAAKILYSLEIEDHRLLEIGLDLEGHADNMAACLIGGLVIVIQDGNTLITRKLLVKPLQATIALPQVKLSTQEARDVLPVSYSRQDTVFNIGRSALLIGSLVSGDYSILATAMQDRVHQLYRLGLIPGAENALQAALNAGALGAVLSGAGPSVIAFHAEKDAGIAAAMQLAFEKEKAPARIFELTTSDAGAAIS
jgi:homoserine kinase